MLRFLTGRAGPSGFGSASTAEEVTQGIDASNLTAIITEVHTYIQGKYFVDCNELKTSKYANDQVLAKVLWDFSNKIINAAADNY